MIKLFKFVSVLIVLSIIVIAIVKFFYSNTNEEEYEEPTHI